MEKVKTREDYPMVLSTKEVMELMQVKEDSARKFIAVANRQLQAEGYIVPVVRRSLVPRDKFFRIMGLE